MTDPEGLILDFYSGPRGWSEGLRHLGLADVGVEWDTNANLTARAAGHVAVQADCTTWPVAHLAGRVRLLIGSPPCTAFSMAGKGDGREHVDELVAAMRTGDWFAPIREREELVVWAPLDMGRLIEECWPDAIALEQVPPCLPLWEALAAWLRQHGYSTWCSVVNAADYGVPQTRRRAILLASRSRPMTGPVPTHDRDPQPTLFGPELQPWVSMARALGWGIASRPSATVIGGSDDGGHRPLDGGARTRELYRDAYEKGDWEGPWRVGFPRRADHQEATEDGYPARDFRTADEPSFAVTEKARSWQLHPGRTDETRNRRPVPADEPAPTMHFGHDAASWVWTPEDGPPPEELVVATGRNSMKHSRDAQDMVPYERSIGHRQPPMSWKDPVLDRRQTGGDGTRVPDLPITEPAPTITGMANAAWRDRRNDQSGADEVDPDWPIERPATTLAGRDLVTDPGANANRFNGAEKSRNDGYRITTVEALILQSFRPDYPVVGTRTAQFQQIGNAVPPRLAAHMVAAVLGLDPPTFD